MELQSLGKSSPKDSEVLLELMKDLKTTVEKSFTKLDEDIKECRKEIVSLKGNSPSPNTMRLSVQRQNSRSPLASPMVRRRNISPSRWLPPDVINNEPNNTSGLLTNKIISVGQMLPCVNAFKMSSAYKRQDAIIDMEEEKLVEMLQTAIESKNVIETLLCFQAGVDPNQEIHVMECVAIGKPWIQFIMDTWSDEETSFLLQEIGVDKIDLNWKSSGRKNFLHIAAGRSLPKCVILLLGEAKKQGLLQAITSANDFVGYLPVHYAALRLSEVCLSAFIEQARETVTQINPQTGETVLTIAGNMVEKNPQEQIKYQMVFRLLKNHELLDGRFVNLRPTNQSSSPLHHCVVFGTKQDVEKLVEVGAFPERNCEGKSPFFFAAEKGKGNVLKYLLDQFTSGRKSVDINLADVVGDTCLHAAVRRCKVQASATNMVEMLVDKGAQLSKTNINNETPLDLIFENVQDPGDFLENLFSKSIQNKGGKKTESNENRKSEKDEDVRKQFNFDYNILNPRSGGVAGEIKHSNLVLSNLLINVKRNPEEGEKLLSHPLVESFIVTKWRKVGRWFRVQFLSTALFVIIYSIFASFKCMPSRGLVVDSLKDRDAVMEVETVFLLILSPLLLEIILFEFLLLQGQGQGLRFHYKQRLVVTFTIITSVINMVYSDQCDGVFRSISGMSVLFAWFYLFSVISINPTIGTDTLIFVKVCKRLTKLLVAYSSMLFGFMTAFSIVLPGDPSFNHMFIRVNTVLSMLMGEVNLDILPKSAANSTNPYTPQFWTQWDAGQWTAHCLFFLFCFILSIVVFNILTAFAIKDVGEVLKDAEMNKIMKQADYITLLEQSFIAKYLDLNTEAQVTVKPGLSADQRNNFDKKLVDKWQRWFQAKKEN